MKKQLEKIFMANCKANQKGTRVYWVRGKSGIYPRSGRNKQSEQSANDKFHLLWKLISK